MPVSQQERQKKIRKVCEIIDAKIRYCIALQKELSEYSDEQLKEYFSHISTNIPIESLRNNLVKQCLGGEIYNFKAMKDYAESGLIEEHEQLVFISKIYQYINSEEILMAKMKKVKADYEKRLQRGENLAPRKFVDINGSNQYHAVKEIYNILWDILDPVTHELYSNYLKYTEIADIQCMVIEHDKFERLINNCQQKIEKSKKLLNHVTDTFSEFKSMFKMIIEKHANDIKLSSEFLAKQKTLVQNNDVTRLRSSAYQAALLSTYHMIYTCKTSIDDLVNVCNKIIKEQTDFLREQAAIRAEFAAWLAKETREKQRQSQNDALIKKQNDEKRAAERQASIVIEQQRIKIEEEAKRKDFANVIAARNKEIEEKRIMKEKIKMESRKAITDDKQIFSQDNGRLHSQFKLSDEIIQKNQIELVNILSQETQEISFAKAVTLIERLGGKVICNGGSHHKIIFCESVFSYIEQDSAKFVAGLPRPHGPGTKLRRFELSLLKNAILSLLSDDWQKELTLRIAVIKLQP